MIIFVFITTLGVSQSTETEIAFKSKKAGEALTSTGRSKSHHKSSIYQQWLRMCFVSK